jgi:4-hydroxy-2-oxoheptanedioate aldolase
MKAMDRLLNPFKQALKAGRLQIGLWHSLASNLAVEILADSGFDWILLDTEHAPNELPMVQAELQAMGGGTAHAVVRAAWNDQVIIKRLLDTGAQSLLIPYVETEEEARRAVMSVRYPPDGFRGVASLTRANRYGRIKGYFEAAHEQLCLLLQVETKRGLENLDKIARVEGVDGVFIGPSDLSAGLGYLGKPTHPEVVKTIGDTIRRIKDAGRAPGILTADPKLAQHYIEAGSIFIAVGSDVGLLANAADQLAQTFRSQNPGR